MTDLILFNANVITMDPTFPIAHSVTICKGKIEKVGRNDDLTHLRNSKTRVIDCHGKTILPGFIDPHIHFHGFA